MGKSGWYSGCLFGRPLAFANCGAHPKLSGLEIHPLDLDLDCSAGKEGVPAFAGLIAAELAHVLVSAAAQFRRVDRRVEHVLQEFYGDAVGMDGAYDRLHRRQLPCPMPAMTVSLAGFTGRTSCGSMFAADADRNFAIRPPQSLKVAAAMRCCRRGSGLRGMAKSV